MFYIFAILILAGSYFVWYFIFNIYEVRIDFRKKTGSDVEYVLTVVPLNSLGMDVPFRKCRSEFSVKGDVKMINIKSISAEKGEMILEKISDSGEIELVIESEYSLRKNIVKIISQPMGLKCVN
ncbi:MAG: hypothetical protein K9I71_00420 [Ignavibacteriales bacterium]|nr:hypothetical protein [Ignavibacteriales bacterium]MCF8314552.1 hypothetical protein [Ignavibacteriales bacterium]MCF8436411.1 hypothetical protein [Ignavibacteriales bacterium]